ncbi:MAG: heme-binding domain-containing protein [Paludibacteraceae bacterium]
MRLIIKILLAIVILFVAIQFIPSSQNVDSQESATDISKSVIMPNRVQSVLKNACYDCHSNNTHYPWYSKIQPVRLMMDTHVKEGKAEINFSEFGSYSTRSQINKLKGLANSVKDNIMPLSSYKLMHKNANLSEEEKDLIINWALQTSDSLSTKK